LAWAEESGTLGAKMAKPPGEAKEVMQTYLAVMAGGALGVAARMFLSNWVAQHAGETFPWGTLVVNVLGCFVIGIFAGLAGPFGNIMISPLTRQVVMIGVLGGFTTFSSFSLQTLTLLSNGQYLYAGANVGLSVVVCLAATWAGLTLAAWFAHP
jgi:CrcB protein